MVRRLARLIVSREVVTYLIAGVLATLVNLVTFTLLSTVFGSERWYITNVPAIGLSLLFAFLTNRWFVFRSKGPIWTEFKKFVLSRLSISLLFEYGAMALLYNGFGLRAALPIAGHELSIAKLLTQFAVVAGNYLMSKLFIFTHRPEHGEPS